jgi:hypothetical protein
MADDTTGIKRRATASSALRERRSLLQTNAINSGSWLRLAKACPSKRDLGWLAAWPRKR